MSFEKGKIRDFYRIDISHSFHNEQPLGLVFVTACCGKAQKLSCGDEMVASQAPTERKPPGRP